MATQDQPSWKRRIGLWGVGYTANFLMVKAFDLVLYPAVFWAPLWSRNHVGFFSNSVLSDTSFL